MPLDASPPNEISISTTDDVPIFFRYRTGGGRWQAPEVTSGHFVFRVYDEYEIVAVCGNSTVGYDVGYDAGTFRERLWLMPCRTPTVRSPRVSVTGTMIQAGRVAMIDFATSTTGNWDFELQVPVGTHDLMASGNGRAMIRRGVEISAATDIADIDVDADGSALVDIPLVVNGTLEDDVLSTRSYWGTMTLKGVQKLVEEPGTTAHMAPDALLAPSDSRYFAVDAISPPRFRSAVVHYLPPTSSNRINLLPRLDDVQFGDNSVTWDSLPRAHQGALDLVSGMNSMSFRATYGWLRTRKSLAIDTDIPGFRPEWKLGPLDYRRFTVLTSTFDDDTSNWVTLRSGIEEVFSPTRTVRERAQLGTEQPLISVHEQVDSSRQATSIEELHRPVHD